MQVARSVIEGDVCKTHILFADLYMGEDLPPVNQVRTYTL
jgi:hypothetical protein